MNKPKHGKYYKKSANISLFIIYAGWNEPIIFKYTTKEEALSVIKRLKSHGHHKAKIL